MWVSWTNQNSFAMHSNQWDCVICIDNRLRQMPVFFVFVKICGVRDKGRLSSYVGRFWTNKALSVVGSLIRYYIKQIDCMLLCVCSVIDHRRRQNVVRTSVTHSVIASCATFLFLQYFDVICDLLLNRRTATWCLFVNYITQQSLILLCELCGLVARDFMTYSQYLFVHWLMCIYVTGG